VLDVLRLNAAYLAGTYNGATLPVLLAFAALPLLRRDKLVLAAWASVLVGLAAVMTLTGLRPTVGLYLPYVTIMTSLVGVTLASCCRARARIAARRGGGLGRLRRRAGDRMR
jgi:hypothetical protein